MASAQTEVYMEVPAVRDMAKKFHEISEVLTNVAKALEALSTILKTTAFVGLVGGAAIASYIDQIKPQIQKVGDKCEELNKDLASSADAYERGDQQGATKFY